MSEAASQSSTPSRAPITEHPHVQQMRLRAKLERVVDKLLAAIDAIDGDADREPSLGAPEGRYSREPRDQRQWADGQTDDTEDEHDGREPPEDEEDTLGRSENIDQSRQEFGRQDLEPSLGSLGVVDQRFWADHYCTKTQHILDGEEQCEDEGFECDREPEDDW